MNMLKQEPVAIRRLVLMIVSLSVVAISMAIFVLVKGGISGQSTTIVSPEGRLASPAEEQTVTAGSAKDIEQSVWSQHPLSLRSFDRQKYTDHSRPLTGRDEHNGKYGKLRASGPSAAWPESDSGITQEGNQAGNWTRKDGRRSVEPKGAGVAPLRYSALGGAGSLGSTAAAGSDSSSSNPSKDQMAWNPEQGSSDPALKKDFFCDLARQLRENCEMQPRSPKALEFCLKANGYYTNSRHCGYRP